MRLFIGIDLPISLKQNLYTIAHQVSTKTQGRVTALMNYHLTLVFLGELDEIQKDHLIENLKTLSFTPFQLDLNSLGYFQKGERFIYYMGLKQSSELRTLYHTVSSLIRPLNLDLHGSFEPHITLIRQGKSYPVEVLKLPTIEGTFEVSKVTLFLSHQVNDELTYTPIDLYPQTN